METIQTGDLKVVRDTEKIKLVKGQRDKYGWEVTIQALTLDSTSIERLVKIDKELKEHFGGVE